MAVNDHIIAGGTTTRLRPPTLPATSPLGPASGVLGLVLDRGGRRVAPAHAVRHPSTAGSSLATRTATASCSAPTTCGLFGPFSSLRFKGSTQHLFWFFAGRPQGEREFSRRGVSAGGVVSRFSGVRRRVGVLVTPLPADPIGPSAGYLCGEALTSRPGLFAFSELLGTS